MKPVQNHFLECFSEAGGKELLSNAQEMAFDDQAIVFDEGGVSDAIFMVIAGQVKLTKDADGQSVELTTISSGNYFGEWGVIDGSERSARATCIGPTQLIKVDGRQVLDVIRKESSSTAIRLFRHVLEDLRVIDQKFANERIRKEKLHIIGEAAGAIIHDFRNPITSIQLSATLLRSKHADPATQKRCDVIVQQSDRMVVMVQELLDFTKGKPNLKLEKISVGKFYEQFRHLNIDFLSENKVEIIIHPSDVLVEIDIPRMLRVFQNLVTNAIEAIKSNAVITLSSRDNGNSIELSVKDNGPGIPESIRENLFDAFVTHGKANGTGLGTAIAKMMVECHDGEIRFETETDKGTTFFIKLNKAS
jgi:signal transduction histidine kinase